MSTWDVKAGRVIYISYISHFVIRVQLAHLNWWVVFNLSSCGLYLPLSATQQLSHRIQTNKNRKRHIPCAYMNNTPSLMIVNSTKPLQYSASIHVHLSVAENTPLEHIIKASL